MPRICLNVGQMKFENTFSCFVRRRHLFLEASGHPNGNIGIPFKLICARIGSTPAQRQKLAGILVKEFFSDGALIILGVL